MECESRHRVLLRIYWTRISSEGQLQEPLLISMASAYRDAVSLFRKIYRSSKASDASTDDDDFEASRQVLAIRAVNVYNVSHIFALI